MNDTLASMLSAFARVQLEFTWSESGIIPAYKVKAVDTTAAGDTFIGALASLLKKDYSNLVEAIQYGNKASSITVQRFGAQPSIPFQHEINERGCKK